MIHVARKIDRRIKHSTVNEKLYAIIGRFSNLGIDLYSKFITLKIKKSKGDVNYLIIIAAVAVVFIIIGWPILKGMVGRIFNTISNWFTANMNKVFS